ncbi:MAG TPA: radical SAM protein [Candidatus Dormibacteraeota bacterium]
MKIAFIALSGVRAQNEELTRLGMTLPGFVERSRVIASLPSLSLLTLAGMTPNDIEVEYHEIADIRRLGALPDCDLAAFATFTAQSKDAYAVSRLYREAGVTTVIGGLHATACPDEALQHFDSVVVGEGEPSWPLLLRDFRGGRLQRTYRSDGLGFSLDDAPMPRFELLDPRRYNRLTVQTQRGCPWKCDFCASSITLTPRYKVKPVAKVIAEIRAIKSIWSRPFIEFADDNTFVNKRHARDLMRAIGKEHVRWFTETDLSVADDTELLAMMRDAGCAQVLIGLESPSALGLEGVETRQNWKRKRLATYMAAIERIQSHGIAVNGCFVLGLDGDGPQVFDDVWNFVENSGLQQVQITVMTAFPGTPLYGRLKAEGRIITDGAWEMCTLFDVNYVPKRMSVRELERGLMDLGLRLYSREAKLDRTARFRRQFKHGMALRRAPAIGRTSGAA